MWRVVRRRIEPVPRLKADLLFQALLVWRVVRRIDGGEPESVETGVSNLVGVESGSEGPGNVITMPDQQGFKPCWCGEWFGGFGFHGGSHVGGDCFKPCWCGEWFGGKAVRTCSASSALFQTLLVWRVVRRLRVKVPEDAELEFQTLLVWRVVRRSSG